MVGKQHTGRCPLLYISLVYQVKFNYFIYFQDEFGNLNYGYSNLNVAKHEIGNAYTGVSGGYSYVDANGQLQTVNYVADGK